MDKYSRFKIASILFIMVALILTTGFTYPSPSADSAILIDSVTGRVMYSLNPNLKKPMASTTKIMTALLAIEHGDLNSKVKVKKSSVGIEGSSIYLMENEEVLLKDMIYGLMLRSGNDAAVAIAEHISGSVDEFVKLMNKRAKEIGANNTNFVNPHGLHHQDHYSTAYDLAIITREGMKQDFFREVSKTKLWVADRDINQYFYNKNDVLWEYKGGDGVKIGYTKASGRCLVASATRDEMQLISVVINDGNWFNDCYEMLNYGFENFKPALLLSKGQFLKEIQIINGDKEKYNALYDSDLIIPLKEGEKDKIKILVNLPDTIPAPVEKCKKLGNILVFLEGKLLYTKEIESSVDIKNKNVNLSIIDFLYKIFK
ncbi:D-alanyl-D-alanine carboxypeptidase (penicillin-binding protein 5/6) [Proteiniborus ethanoligenes]|uniref:serine-type D-Ala-D-Ala carboxypeptidase n=1 Tax=Proteiniborus ethanoligenes TaxID=415015 RepID=A0A1H3KB74_9FIRM|nr:D-alanyl-D-alanine carboxypeptidase family protein [Proteiniborus ethanoligenes]SDY49420.1 D-alanyl-D-alanine carboxypeptidase (penicillin-binding protein 5/6) [Proteiniborus ethanoligenes]